MNLKNIFKIAGLIAVITILSKVIGFFRDIVIAGAYGASFESDAYFYAYQIPALALILLGGLGGPFHTVTVAIFSKEDTNALKPSTETEKVLNTFLNITGLGFIAITILVFFSSEFIAKIIAAGGSVELQQMISEQLKIMSPIMFIGGIIGILFGISNVREKFLLTAASPIITSVVIITAVLIAGGKYGGLVLAWSTLVGAALQLLIQIPAYFNAGFKYKFDIDWNNEKVVKTGEILFPAMLGCSIGQVTIYVDMFFASQLPEGSWSAIGYANRIFQFPVGIIITAMLVSIFPAFSKLVGEKNWEKLKYYFHKGINYLWFVSFPVFIFLALFSYEIIKLLLERGNFDTTDTFMVTEVLFFLSFAIVFYAARDTLTRMFYAFDDAKTPFLVAFISIFLKTAFNFLLVKPLGIGGIALSTVIVSAINGIFLAVLIRKKINLEFKKLLPDLKKIIFAGIVMAGIAYCSKIFLGQVLGHEKIYIALNIIISCSLASIVYFLLAIALKIEAAEQFFEKIKLKISENYKKG